MIFTPPATATPADSIRSVWSWEMNERMMPRMVMARIVRTNLVNLVAMGGGIFITGSFLFYKTVVKSSAQKAMKLSGLVSMRVPK
jgi:hypothetical protein